MNDSTDTGRPSKNALDPHPKPSTSRNTGGTIMNVTATTLDDRRHQMNGVQAYHTLAPGPTKQPYYPAIRFVEQHKDIPANQQPRLQPVPQSRNPTTATIKTPGHPEATKAALGPAKTRLDTSMGAPYHRGSVSAPQDHRPINLLPATSLNFQYDGAQPRLRPASRGSVSSPVPERRHTVDATIPRPPLQHPSRRHSDQSAPPHTPISATSPSPATPNDSNQPFPRVVSRTGALTPPHIRQAAAQAIAPVQALFEQAWNTNVHMVHQQLTRIYQDTDARHRSEISAADTTNARLRRERDEARSVANRLSVELEGCKAQFLNASEHIRSLESEINRLRRPQQVEVKPSVKREREEPPTPNSSHSDESRRHASEQQGMRVIRLSPHQDPYTNSKPLAQATDSPYNQPSSPFVHPSSSPRNQPTSSPSLRHPHPPRRRPNERGMAPGLSRQDSTSSSTSSRRMEVETTSTPARPSSTKPRSPPSHNQTRAPSRTAAPSDHPVGALSPPPSTLGPQPKLEPQPQHSLPRFATLDLPAINTKAEPDTVRPYKRSRTTYEGEGVSTLSSSSKVTKTTYQDTPGASSREQSVKVERAPSRPPSVAPMVVDEVHEDGEVSASGDSDKEQRPPLQSAYRFASPTIAPSPRQDPAPTVLRMQARAQTPREREREREPFRTSSLSNSTTPKSNVSTPGPSHAVPKAEVAPIKKGLGIKHMQLLYETRNQELVCKMCMKMIPRTPPVKFPVTAPWLELLKHCEDQHPADCQDIERLGTGSLAEMSVRQRKAGIPPSKK